jgi:GNAT superfamily N-acetyltransferase
VNLQTSISIFAGGPGSGCNPDVGTCGRTPSSFSSTLRPTNEGEGRGHLVTLKNGEHEVGSAYIVPELGKKHVASIDSSPGVPKELRGQGYGKELYRRVFEHARQLGYRTIKSEYAGNRTDDATHVWESLKKERRVYDSGTGDMQHYYTSVQ